MNTEAMLLILKTVMALSTKQGLNVSVAVYDPNCQLAGFVRMPESYVGSVKSSQEKGKSACLFQRDTKAFEEAVSTGRTGLLSASEVVAVSGGVALFKEKKFLGSIGISGGRAVEDHDLGKAAIKSLGYTAE